MTPPASPPAPSLRRGAWRQFVLALGPGLVVMLADTEAGSVVSAAQGGADWGYRLVLPQFLLIPALFMAQELAARLGLGTGCGLAELVTRRFGHLAGGLLLATLAASCFGAVVTELSGIAGVGELFGIPAWQSSAVAAAGLLAVVWTGTYRSVERVALALGACEIAFVVLAWMAHPDPALMLAEMVRMPLGDHAYLYLLAANLGTCVIPWAIFYQQAASIDKGLTPANLAGMRAETFAGAVLCQTITAAVVVAAAGAFRGSDRALSRIGDIADAFSQAVGPLAAHVIFALGLSGGALVAAIVVCLTVAWSFGEALGRRHSLGDTPQQAPWFYAAFAVVLAGGAALVGIGGDLMTLSIGAGVLNALLLPVVLGFLYVAAMRDPPAGLQLRGRYAVAVALVFALTGGLGLYAGVAGLL
jgi:Mn2+/Fe2+ NRAMP family transporter